MILSPYFLKSLHDNLLPRVMPNRIKIELSPNDIVQINLLSAPFPHPDRKAEEKYLGSDDSFFIP